MGFMSKVRGKLTKTVDQHGDKIAGGIDKAAAAANKKTGGKHHDKISKATQSAKDGLDKLDGRNDDISDSPTAPGPTVTGPTSPGPTAPGPTAPGPTGSGPVAPR